MRASDTQDSGYYALARPEMRAFLPTRRARLLDVGCGNGMFAASLDGVQETWGIEPTEAAEAAATRLHHVIRGTFDAARPHLPLQYFDVIVCNDVIEHMPDHDAFLSRI